MANPRSSIGIVEPNPGAQVNRTFSLRGGAGLDPSSVNQNQRLAGTPSVFIRFNGHAGVGGTFTIAQNGAWTFTNVTMPASIADGATIHIEGECDAMWTDIRDAGHESFDADPAFTSLDVVLETRPPELTITADYPTDVIPASLPYLAKIHGTTSGALSGINAVVVSVDGRPEFTAENVSGDWAIWRAQFPLDAADHQFLVTARDTRNRHTSQPGAISVHERFEDTDPAIVFGPTIYVRELCDLAKQYVQIGGQAGGVERSVLTTQFHQPYDRLPEAALFDVATAPVDQRRIAVEVLRQSLSTPPPVETDQRLRGLAYEALLRQLGTSDHYRRLLAGGISQHERDQLFDLGVARDLAIAAGTLKGIGAFIGKPTNILGGLGEIAGGLSQAASLDAQIEGTKAGFERRAQEWQLQQSLALNDVEIARQQTALAETQQRIAAQEQLIAGANLAHAAATADFLATKFTSAELFEWMSTVLNGVYAYFLRQATALARLAQAQLAFERQEPDRGLVQDDYWQGPPSSGAPHRPARGHRRGAAPRRPDPSRPVRLRDRPPETASDADAVDRADRRERAAAVPADRRAHRTISDVLLTIEYTALASAQYREKVVRTIDRTFLGDRTFSVREQFPDVWFDLNDPDGAAHPMRIDLPLTADDFPRHIEEQTVAQLTMFVVRADGFDRELTVTSARHVLPGRTVAATAVTTVGGIVGTRRPGGTPWVTFTGAAPDGEWQFQLTDTPQVRSWFTDGKILDVVLVTTIAGTTPAWT